jgi:hypothetical protein
MFTQLEQCSLVKTDKAHGNVGPTGLVCRKHVPMIHYRTKLLHNGWKPATWVTMLLRIIMYVQPLILGKKFLFIKSLLEVERHCMLHHLTVTDDFSFCQIMLHIIKMQKTASCWVPPQLSTVKRWHRYSPANINFESVCCSTALDKE